MRSGARPCDLSLALLGEAGRGANAYGCGWLRAGPYRRGAKVLWGSYQRRVKRHRSIRGFLPPQNPRFGCAI